MHRVFYSRFFYYVVTIFLKYQTVALYYIIIAVYTTKSTVRIILVSSQSRLRDLFFSLKQFH